MLVDVLAAGLRSIQHRMNSRILCTVIVNYNTIYRVKLCQFFLGARLIQKWLKAGLLEDSQWSETKLGTLKEQFRHCSQTLHCVFDL